MYATLEPVLNKLACIYKLNPRTYREGGGGGGCHPPCKVFLSFFVEDKTSVPDVFSSCLFIPHAQFERGLVMVSCYGYEI